MGTAPVIPLIYLTLLSAKLLAMAFPDGCTDAELSGYNDERTMAALTDRVMTVLEQLALRDGEEVFTEAAPGDGPVDAAFNAIDRIAGRDDIKLESYEIRAVTEGTDALGEAKVKISGGGASFTGRGVSTDILKSSIKAYINAVNKCVAAQAEQEG